MITKGTGHFYVYYTDSFKSGRYGVYRAFPSQEAAQQFIDDNALVCPLPDCRMTEVMSYFPFTEREIPHR